MEHRPYTKVITYFSKTADMDDLQLWTVLRWCFITLWKFMVQNILYTTKKVITDLHKSFLAAPLKYVYMCRVHTCLYVCQEKLLVYMIIIWRGKKNIKEEILRHILHKGHSSKYFFPFDLKD